MRPSSLFPLVLLILVLASYLCPVTASFQPHTLLGGHALSLTLTPPSSPSNTTTIAMVLQSHKSSMSTPPVHATVTRDGQALFLSTGTPGDVRALHSKLQDVEVSVHSLFRASGTRGVVRSAWPTRFAGLVYGRSYARASGPVLGPDTLGPPLCF